MRSSWKSLPLLVVYWSLRMFEPLHVHFNRFIASQVSPGVLLLPSSKSIGAAIEGLLAIWLAWTPEDLRNQVRWLP